MIICHYPENGEVLVFCLSVCLFDNKGKKIHILPWKLNRVPLHCDLSWESIEIQCLESGA